jgi:hypothetical protein
MVHRDEQLKELERIIAHFATFCHGHGAASETDTRVKVIDAILKDVCGWPEADLSREDHSENGFSDYALKIRDKPTVIVEAKREGETFRLPKDKTSKTYTLDGVLVSDPTIKAAINQVHSYCTDHGARYAIATNGYAWIVFRAIRDDMPWRKGKARVFPSLEYIRDNILDFLDLLSYDAIQAGALHEEFSPSITASRELHRVIDLLWNADVPLSRNRLNSDLQPIVKMVFEDIASQESLDVLHSCYIHTGSLRRVANDLGKIFTEAIPKFLVDAGAHSVGEPGERHGFERVLKDAIAVTKGELFLLLGGIGSGKSTFLKRYLRDIGRAALDEKTMWFAIDFLGGTIVLAEMEKFVWDSVLKDVRERYAEFHCEKRKYLNEVFDTDITALQSTLLEGMKEGTFKYNETLSPHLYKWQLDTVNYVPRLLRTSCERLGRVPVLLIDNVDQLSPEYQAQIFLLAQRLTRMVGAISLVSLREESYYTISVQKAFTAYTSRKFHVASPHFRKMIGNRIEYAIKMLQVEIDRINNTSESFPQRSIRDFLLIVQEAMVENIKIGRFIKAICHGNMRFALEMFSTFVTSGTTDVDKMLRIYYRDGAYNIADHEFIKAVMLKDRAYYKEEQSPIANVFNVGAQKNSSHLTACRILHVLMQHRGESTPEGQGYVDINRLLYQFDDVFSNQDDFIVTMNRLVTRNLIEVNTRSTESIKDASHVRVTSAGWYYVRYLSSSFAYLDLVLQDTPINDAGVEKVLRESVYKVNNLTDQEEHKLERVRARLDRVRRFLAYLQKEEEAERRYFGLDDLSGPLSVEIVPVIRKEFEQEAAWVDGRIRENRERYRQDYVGTQYDEEDRMMGLIDEAEEESD